MANKRLVRINEEIQRELASLLRAAKDPRICGIVSIIAVEATPDLRYAKVRVSVLGNGDAQDTLKGLKSAAGFFRHELGQKILLRYVPELLFELDHSIEEGAHILRLISDLNRKPEPAAEELTSEDA